MMNPLATMVATFLAAKDRDAVLGDLAEVGAGEWRSLCSVLGLVVRRQIEPWRVWQPWVASGVAFAASLLLLGVSFGLSKNSRDLLRGGRGYGSVLCAALLMLSWAWTSEFMVGSLSRKARWVSGILCLIPCLSCVVRFQDSTLPRLCLLLFLLPGAVGAMQGVRRARLSHKVATRLAIAITVLMSMTALITGWGGMYMRNWLLLLPVWWLVVHAERSESLTEKMTV